MLPTTSTPETLVRGELTLRPATLDDAAFEADVDTALFPDEPIDPALHRHWLATEYEKYTYERFVVLEGDAPIGYAWQRHWPWEKMPERYSRVEGDLLPRARTAARLAAIYDLIEERSRVDGARTLVTHAREDDAFKIELLAGRGYREERRGKGWELDVVRNRQRLLAMAEASRTRMREQGIEVLTLDRDPDPEKFRKLHRMTNEASEDVPRTVPYLPDPFDVFMKSFESPGLRPDRVWIARSGDDVVGISMLEYPPTRGNVWTSWTGTARAIRGRGVARALKLETVVQAIALGVPRVRTDNDGHNAPILHLNEDLGYERIPGWITFLKVA